MNPFFGVVKEGITLVHERMPRYEMLRDLMVTVFVISSFVTLPSLYSLH